jgi:hypothetical protein
MRISDPETRRGIRTLVQACIQFALIAVVCIVVETIKDDAHSLYLIALAALCIIATYTLGYVMETSLRVFKLNASKEGVTVDASSETDTPS